MRALFDCDRAIFGMGKRLEVQISWINFCDLRLRSVCGICMNVEQEIGASRRRERTY